MTDEEEAKAYVAERVSDAAFGQLSDFVTLLRTENTRQNLVSAKSLDHVWCRHIADSIQLLDHAPRETETWLDLGSGAGLPGIVIAIARPDIHTALVESRSLRIAWLSELVDRFALQSCRILGMPLETVETEKFDVISARAFAPLDRLLRSARRFSTSDTTWLLPKGRSAAQEVASLPVRMRRGFHVEQSATDPDAGIVVGQLAESHT